jgi:hypothetical protein
LKTPYSQVEAGVFSSPVIFFALIIILFRIFLGDR